MDKTLQKQLTLRITGLRFFGYHGVFDEEKRTGSDYQCDIEIHSTVPDADTLASTYDYTKAMEIVMKHNKHSYDLIETLAADICTEVMLDMRIRSCTVRIRKYVIPVEHTLSYVEAEFTLTR
jgi:dihydroneopterin aldolase